MLRSLFYSTVGLAGMRMLSEQGIKRTVILVHDSGDKANPRGKCFLKGSNFTVNLT